MSAESSDENKRELNKTTRYPFEIDNRFSLMGYCAAITILLVATALGLDDLKMENVMWYGIFTTSFHLILEIASRQRLMSVRLHSIFYELVGMLIWVISFAYAATLLNELRPILLIGSFLTVNFSVGRGQVALGTRVTFAVAVIYMCPAVVALVLGHGYESLYRDLILVTSFLAVSLHGLLVANHFGPANIKSRSSNR